MPIDIDCSTAVGIGDAACVVFTEAGCFATELIDVLILLAISFKLIFPVLGDGNLPNTFLTPVMPAFSIVSFICEALSTHSGPFSPINAISGLGIYPPSAYAGNFSTLRTFAVIYSAPILPSLLSPLVIAPTTPPLASRCADGLVPSGFAPPVCPSCAAPSILFAILPSLANRASTPAPTFWAAPVMLSPFSFRALAALAIPDCAFSKAVPTAIAPRVTPLTCLPDASLPSLDALMSSRALSNALPKLAVLSVRPGFIVLETAIMLSCNAMLSSTFFFSMLPAVPAASPNVAILNNVGSL